MDTWDRARGRLTACRSNPVGRRLFGCMPLMAYVASALVAHRTGIASDPRSSFILSTVISALSLFSLGGIKSQFGEGIWWRAGMEVRPLRVPPRPRSATPHSVRRL